VLVLNCDDDGDDNNNSNDNNISFNLLECLPTVETCYRKTIHIITIKLSKNKINKNNKLQRKDVLTETVFLLRTYSIEI
jgi:hypothetical protein